MLGGGNAVQRRPVYGRVSSLKPGKLSGRGLARFVAQLPITRDRLISMGEGDTPLVPTAALGQQLGLRRMILKDERRNPTGSWRDRFAALAVSQVEDTSDDDRKRRRRGAVRRALGYASARGCAA